MKLARFRTSDNRIQHGIVTGDTIEVIDGDLFGTRQRTGQKLALGSVRLLAPLTPVNLLCFGRNYKAHAEEGGDAIPKQPLLFLKATTSVIGPDDSIQIPAVAPAQVDYEAELAVIIGRAARHVSEAEALSYVLGYTCANDVSARDVQNGDGQWARGKSFDTFCPLGPWVETELNPRDVRVQGRHNGRPFQDARTTLLIFSVPYLISYVSRCMTLVPGTVLLTGTPAGCGFAQKPPAWLMPGTVFEVEIESIGTLRNPVIAE